MSALPGLVPVQIRPGIRNSNCATNVCPCPDVASEPRTDFSLSEARPGFSPSTPSQTSRCPFVAPSHVSEPAYLSTARVSFPGVARPLTPFRKQKGLTHEGSTFDD